jgi:IS5 family transposase
MCEVPEAETLLADRGQDADRLHKALDDRGIQPFIPSRRGRRTPVPHNPSPFRARHRIENSFACLRE